MKSNHNDDRIRCYKTQNVCSHSLSVEFSLWEKYPPPDIDVNLTPEKSVYIVKSEK